MGDLQETSCFACFETGHTNERIFAPGTGTFIPATCPICNGCGTVHWSRRGPDYRSAPAVIGVGYSDQSTPELDVHAQNQKRFPGENPLRVASIVVDPSMSESLVTTSRENSDENSL